MPEKTWDMVYDAIMDLARAVNALNEKVDKGFAEMNTRFDRVEERLGKIEKDHTLLKLKQFDSENDIAKTQAVRF